MRFGYRARSNPTSQQQAPEQQAAPAQASGMSAYAGPRTPPQGARTNDLSGDVPANQMWGKAYNQASNQYGGNTQAQSWTMPGYYSSQGVNPVTGQASKPTGGESWDGNMAYNAIDQRPGPITATGIGVGGNPIPWQDSLTQRDAFVGNLSQRLGQYSGGQLSGPVTIDPAQLLGQANDQLAKGTFYNPFSQQNPDVQKAMGGTSQFASGSQWQNPFGDGPQPPSPSGTPQYANPPSSAPSYRITAQGVAYNEPYRSLSDSESQARWDKNRLAMAQRQLDDAPATPQPASAPPASPGAAQPRPAPSRGTRYNPWELQSSLPPVQSEARNVPPIRAPRNMVIVPVNRRGSSARFGGMRQNGGNRR